MSLPILGGPPPRPPTHEPIAQEELSRLARGLVERVAGGRLDAEVLAGAASDLDAPLAHVYAAAGFVPIFQFAREHPTVFLVCSGGCQQYGAIPVIERLLALRDERSAAEQPSFDVHTRGCLDRCELGAMVAVFTADGVATVPKASPETITEAVCTALG